MKTAFIFPGQGAQSVGMGRDLYEAFAAARVVFDSAQSITGLPLQKLCFEGPEEELARTDICQPAIFTVSAALLATMSSLLDPENVAQLRPAFMAGLSLGEYTALYAAGVISFEDALRLVARRGAAMQSAATAVASGMVSVMGVDEAKARELCEKAAQGQVLTCANFNCPGQIVLSGQIEACKRAEAMAKECGASGAIPLKVAGAFHSDIMKPASDELAKALASVQMNQPAAPAGSPFDRTAPARPEYGQEFASSDVGVLSNVTAQPYFASGGDCGCGCGCHTAANQVSQLLQAQLTNPVRWQQCVEYMVAQGVQRFCEIGPGRVLAGLMRRIDRKAEVVSVNSREALEKLTVA